MRHNFRHRASSSAARAGRGAMVLTVIVSALTSTAPSAQELAASESSNKDISVGFTAEGYPFRGDPEAPVTLEEFSDYLCPYCERHYRQTAPELLEKYVRAGRVKLVFRDFPIAALHPHAAAAAESALCVGEQNAALFWVMHDTLFESRKRWTPATSPDELLAGLAAEAGADVEQYEACKKSGHKKELVDASVTDAQNLGFNGTPSFRFSGGGSKDDYTFSGAHPLSKFEQWLDAMLAGNAPPAPPPPELPYWASPEGRAPDPARSGFTLAGDAYKGDPGAPLVVVEFSDFQCPSCRRHALNTEPVLDEKFIASGKVFWIFKNLPLSMHPNAPAAAAAAECAGEQDKFWKMKRLLFEEAEAWTEGAPDEAIVALAGDAGLDTGAFRACFEGRKAMERVLKDIYDSRGVATTTPTFVVIYGGRGRLMKGARQPDEFITYLEKALAQASE